MSEAHRRLESVVSELRKASAGIAGLDVHVLSSVPDPSAGGGVRPEFVSVTFQPPGSEACAEFEVDLSENRADVDAFSGVGGAETRLFGPDHVPFSLSDGYRIAVSEDGSRLQAEDDELRDLDSGKVFARRIVDHLRFRMQELGAES